MSTSKIKKKIDEFFEEQVEPVLLQEIMSDRFGRYSKYIIQDRALPDARDGLKPVQRRILFAMQQMGLTYNKPHKKAARVAGEVMGKYHPHGDSSIYEALVRLSQNWKMRLPLIDMHGNNGSIDGDSAAAMRYTEARLSQVSDYLLKDIDKRTVTFVPNFDDEEVEPTVLPAKFPNLLVNGAMGISAGYATKIPPHNLGEVIDATLALIDNPNLSDQSMIKYIKGPDFPTGGIVQGLGGIKDALTTGSGRVIIRARTEVRQLNKLQEQIIISEIPYEVNKGELVRQIDSVRIQNQLDDIIEVRDETDQSGLSIAIDLKKGADSKVILNFLYKNTDLQISFNYNMVAIMNNRPVLAGVKQLLLVYIDHQKDVITNRSNYELRRAEKRLHIVEGLIKMVSVLSEVINLIRSSVNRSDSKIKIMDKFNFTDLQAEAIITLQLYRLSTTDVNALKKEAEELNNSIEYLNQILTSERLLLNTIKDELKVVKAAIDEPRMSTIEDEVSQIVIDETQLISDEQVIVGITKDGYVKRSSIRSYQASKIAGMKEDDSFIFLQEVSTLDTIIAFTNKGYYIYLPVFKIDEQRWGDLGVYISNIVPISKDEKLVEVLKISDFNLPKTLLLASRTGMMKQIDLSSLEVSRYSRPIRAMKINKTDELVSVDLEYKNYIVGLTELGYALKFETDEIPSYGLQAGGVKGISLTGGDKLVKALYVNQEDDLYILTNRGNIINDSVSELPIYARNRRGVLVIPRQKSNPYLGVSAIRVSSYQLKDNKNVLIATTKANLELPLSELKYSNNKFGKNLFDESKLGLGYYIYLEPSVSEPPTTKLEPTHVRETTNNDKIDLSSFTEIKKQETEDKPKKITITRLDLFSDEED